MQLEFAVDQRLPQVHLQIAALPHARVHFRLEKPIGTASVGLGPVERHIGAFTNKSLF